MQCFNPSLIFDTCVDRVWLKFQTSINLFFLPNICLPETETSKVKTITPCIFRHRIFFCFFPPAIKFIQVEDCYMCRWFGEASISVSSVIMQTFHTGTLHEQRRLVRGGSCLNQIKACLLAEVWEPAPRWGCSGNEITHNPLVTLSAFLHITVIEMLLRFIKWNSNVACKTIITFVIWSHELGYFINLYHSTLIKSLHFNM